MKTPVCSYCLRVLPGELQLSAFRSGISLHYSSLLFFSHTFIQLLFEPMWILASTGICRKGFRGLPMQCVKETSLCPLWLCLPSDATLLFFLLEVTGTITPGAVSSGCLWLYRLLWCSSFQPEFRLLNYCSYRRLFIPYFTFLTFFMHFAPSFWLDRLRETGLKLKCLNESACVQVKIMTLEWLIFMSYYVWYIICL